MTPEKHPQHTVTFGKPPNWDEARHGPCGSLSVQKVQHEDVAHHLSQWVPSFEELELLLAGGRVELTCVGVQPPVAIAVVPRQERITDAEQTCRAAAE